MKNAIVLAAGKGTRMKSEKPKVLHEILEKPMLGWILDACKKAGAENIVTVVGYHAEEIEKGFAGQSDFAIQSPQLGSGHAVMQAKQLADKDGVTLVVNGDCPCLQASTYEMLYDALKESDMAVLTMIPEDAASYGRIVRDDNGNILKIVEFKDASEAEKKITEVNAGIYAFKNELLWKALPLLKDNNAQHEFYITDLVQIFRELGHTVKAVVCPDWQETQGVNDPVELARASKYLQKKINTKWMKEGIVLMDPDTVYIGPDVTIEHDTVIYPNVYLFGNVHVPAYSTLLPNYFQR